MNIVSDVCVEQWLGMVTLLSIHYGEMDLILSAEFLISSEKPILKKN